MVEPSPGMVKPSLGPLPVVKPVRYVIAIPPTTANMIIGKKEMMVLVVSVVTTVTHCHCYTNCMLTVIPAPHPQAH